MERLNLTTSDIATKNIEKLGLLFPNCLTEKSIDGKIFKAIDFDILRQEVAHFVVEGPEQRYQFTWPDKRAAIRLANTPTSKTLRPCRAESVDFDTTQNLYIEGDNLDVLKLLRENYLGKVKMIYIDPPYNTGNDFVYNDDFAQGKTDFEQRSGLFDEEGHQTIDPMQRNTEANGRFHTDWLNMIYPRLKVARDLLSDDGVIFISIDDNEVENLMKICDEIFGEMNFVAQIPWRKRTAKSDVPFGISQDYEFIICYARSNKFYASIAGGERKYYETPDYPGRPWRVHDLTTQRTASERPNSYFTMVNPKTGEKYPANQLRTWAVTYDTFDEYYNQGRIVFPGDYDFLNISRPAFRYWKEDDMKKAGEDFGRIAVSTKLPDAIGMSQDGTKEVTNLFDGKIFSFPKPSSLIKFFLEIINSKDSLVLDFFSGSATTAHAVMQLNAEDGGNRKFIMVQLPEKTDPKSEAYKAGYPNICEIGKERIRRAGQKIKEENKDKEGIDRLDTGFRVLKLDSSNMADVYYTPAETPIEQTLGFEAFEDNIKPDRTAEDLLFQVMPECNLPLSSRIEEREIHGKKIYAVDGNYLVACFDRDIDEQVITEIARMQPYYFVMRDASAATDNVLDNFDQIFNAYSKETIRRIL